MEQPWPPPGPWSLPRAEGEAEEESDLDVSPGSPRCPQLPGGGAQVRGARILWGVGCGGVGWGGPPNSLSPRLSGLRYSASPHPTPGDLMPSHDYCSIF